MKDFVDRMKEIKDALDVDTAAAGEEPASLEQREALLDELVELVENVDYARGGWVFKRMREWVGGVAWGGGWAGWMEWQVHVLTGSHWVGVRQAGRHWSRGHASSSSLQRGPPGITTRKIQRN